MPLHVFNHVMDWSIHGTENIGIPPTFSSFILYRPAEVTLLNPVVGGIKTDTVTRFIAQGPDDDRWMVLIPLHHTDCPVKVRFSKQGIVAQGAIGLIAHAMRFNIGFIHYI